MLASWLDGWRRVIAAPAVVAGVFGLTFLLALPLAWTMRGLLEAHRERTLLATESAAQVNYDWWQEFTAQASGLGTTFTAGIIGFAATLDNISSLLDGQKEIAPIVSALALYLAGWTFVSGGVIDRYARQRRTRTPGFFAASGVFFVRFLRLALIAGLFYWWMFDVLQPWLFVDWFPRLTRDLSVERTVVAVRVSFYVAFGALLVFGNLLFDYAKIRAVVEDRRSMLGALNAAIRFVFQHPGRTFGLYVVNSATFVAVLAVWAIVAPGAASQGVWLWVSFAIAQLYVIARLMLKLHFFASETSLFQGSLAHAAYTRTPESVWPESPASEAIGRV